MPKQAALPSGQELLGFAFVAAMQASATAFACGVYKRGRAVAQIHSPAFVRREVFPRRSARPCASPNSAPRPPAIANESA
jgi:hypothetical protein